MRGRVASWTLVLSVPIFDEYRRASTHLAQRFGGVDIERLVVLVATSSEFVDPPPLPDQVCSDPDDDKFLACALAARCPIIVSGDRALLRQSGYAGIAATCPSPRPASEEAPRNFA